MTGVLVLVEQHHPVALPQVRADLRERRGKPGGRGHLHAEVHDLRGAHALLQRVDQRHQLGALGLGGQQPQQPLARAAVALVGTGGQGVHQPFQLQVGIAELAGVDQVLGELAPQPQHHRGDRGRRLVGTQLPGIPVDHVEGQLPQLGLAEQPGVGLDGQQQPVVTQQ